MDTDTPGVTSTESPTEAEHTQFPTDRPPENVLAEFNRKFGALKSQNDQLKQQNEAIMAWIASQQSAPVAQGPQTPAGPLSDDDLWARAQQGDREAFAAWNQRQTMQTVSQINRVQNIEAVTTAQINAIMGRYPVMGDPNHPLRQHADLAYRLYLQQGWQPGKATVLEAMKTAITDNPGLVAELHTQGTRASEVGRRSAASYASAGQTGVSHRQSPTTQNGGQGPRISRDQMDLARRMGVKDPKKAIAGFMKRQDEGISRVGAVANDPQVQQEMEEFGR